MEVSTGGTEPLQPHQTLLGVQGASAKLAAFQTDVGTLELEELEEPCRLVRDQTELSCRLESNGVLVFQRPQKPLIGGI